ncbi:hypothetical protein BTA15_20325 [Vibrio parahaemolyticus]|uniref:SMI1/KNR4 family protein n=1 Tax=Vibrio parahaemolyticus TaxID=670 RepID=UPI000472B612|nr:SMI1/KNR4 family protein [Vibrio parahaemolyticus]EGR3454089.1 SMI1/KNR4 family protein [Vibrio parahaemolyticus]OUD49944.1 hypothetical protein BTA15_20325 [Vibrio parahaemolyticus]HCG6653536.1 SMI1/KNR4 family protein [Vibrio parahaemolyticus]
MFEQVRKEILNKAPLVADAFLEPASEEEINLLRCNVGRELPQDLVELYKTSKGQDPEKQANFAYGVALLSIGQTSSLVENYSHDGDGNVLSYTDKGIDKEYTFGKSRIPIADDCSSCLICVDLSPTEEGSFGQVILIDYDYKVALKLADSLAEFISNFKKDLDNNKYCLDKEALKDGFHWLVPDREIDPINWFNSTTWQYVNAELLKIGD